MVFFWFFKFWVMVWSRLENSGQFYVQMYWGESRFFESTIFDFGVIELLDHVKKVINSQFSTCSDLQNQKYLIIAIICVIGFIHVQK